MTRRYLPTALAAGLTALTAVAVEAQPIGTFRWQLQPFCNVVTVNVNQQGAVYTMDGYDDQCGAARRAPIAGLIRVEPPWQAPSPKVVDAAFELAGQAAGGGKAGSATPSVMCLNVSGFFVRSREYG